MKLSQISLKRFVLSDIQENCYLLSLKESSECVIIDPGLDAQPLVEFLQKESLVPKAILITHGHVDHIGGIPEIDAKWNDVPLYIGEHETKKLVDPEANLSSYFGFSFVTREADFTVSDGETINVGGLELKALEIPGHSQGHVVYLLTTEEQSFVFCGDVVFAGSVGRTDFPGGSHSDLIRNIHDKLLSLPNETILYPGHGPATSISDEKQNNPYL